MDKEKQVLTDEELKAVAGGNCTVLAGEYLCNEQKNLADCNNTVGCQWVDAKCIFTTR